MLSSLIVAAIVCASTLLGGCTSTNKRDQLFPPGVIVSPYDTIEGDVLWAVIPPMNESGTSIVDPLKIGDAIVAAAQGVRGVRCLPINRSLDAMRTLGMPSGIESSSDAHKLAEYLGADAVLVGSVTAYDPYDPPVFGLALALYARPGSMANLAQAKLDSRALTSAFTDFGSYNTLSFAGEPVTVVSEHLDARNHEVLFALRSYAQGRSDQTSALGWRIYLASMDLYTQFAAHHTIGRLIDEEWLRLAQQRAKRGPGN